METYNTANGQHGTSGIDFETKAHPCLVSNSQNKKGRHAELDSAHEITHTGQG
jgi:hypothetical protein